MILNKENYKSIIKRKSEIVKIDNVEIKIKALSIKQQIEIEKLNNSDNNEDSLLMFELLKMCCVDDNDEVFLTDEIINTMSSTFVLKLFDKCLRINNLGEKDVEAIAKNS